MRLRFTWLAAAALVAALPAPGRASGMLAPLSCEEPAGFAPASGSVLDPTLRFAAPGPNRAERSAARIQRAIPPTRAFLFEPALDPELERLGDRLPFRVSTLIRAAALWAEPEIPWRNGSGGVRSIAFAGKPHGREFLFSRADGFERPRAPGRYSGLLAIRPTEPAPAGKIPERVAIDLRARLRSDTFGIAEVVDFLSELPRHVPGSDGAAPDPSPGTWSEHDDAARARFARDAPRGWAAVERHVDFGNLLDVVRSDDGSVVTRIDVVAEVRAEALRPFPRLERFFDRILSRIDAAATVRDTTGRSWMLFTWERGTIGFRAAVRDGALVPLDGPGEPLRLDCALGGRFHTDSFLRVSALGIHAGLEGVRFANEWSRDGETVRLVSRMVEPPRIEATPVLQGLLRFAAGDFFEALAGRGGTKPVQTWIASKRSEKGDVLYDSGLRGELLYESSLELLVGLADRFSNELALSVRRDQRQLFAGIYDAFVADYLHHTAANGE